MFTTITKGSRKLEKGERQKLMAKYNQKLKWAIVDTANKNKVIEKFHNKLSATDALCKYERGIASSENLKIVKITDKGEEEDETKTPKM